MKFLHAVELGATGFTSDYRQSVNSHEYTTIKTEITKSAINKICYELNIRNQSAVVVGAVLVILSRHQRQENVSISLAKRDGYVNLDAHLYEEDTLSSILKNCDTLLSDENSFPMSSDHGNIIVNVEEGNARISDTIFDLKFSYKITSQGNVVIVMDFNAGFFCLSEVKYILDHCRNLIISALSYVETQYKAIALPDNSETNTILNGFNATEYDFQDSRNVIRMICDNALKYKSKVAVSFYGNCLTYSQLNMLSSRLANNLIAHGVNSGDFIGLVATRSLEMIVGVIAIMKCGAVYVPIDPSYPHDRIEYILKNCGAKLALTYGFRSHIFENSSLSQVEIDLSIENHNEIKIEKIVNSIRADDLAYCIFTSGTTGNPKGVMLKHGGLANLVKSYALIYGIKDSDTLLQFASIAFDQSVWDIFTILSIGGTLCLIDREMINDPNRLEDYMTSQGVTVAALTPAYIKVLNPKRLPSLYVLESGSAAADYNSIKHWRSGRRVFNTYGPTEATVNTLSYELIEDDGRVLPIGKPIHNVKVYIVNDGILSGIGEPGELCIAGSGVAVGYVGLPELTQNSFIKNPYGQGQMYRTGDLVKWRSDGNVIYLGRIDDQVKIRGFRIELGEIEYRLKMVRGIKDVCLVVVNDIEDSKILAYVTSDGVLPSESKIKDDLSKNLPDYMIPAQIIHVDSFPLTISGKIDKKKLKSIRRLGVTEQVAPVGEFEEKTLIIFKKILSDEYIGVTDDFFAIGGNSIKAIMIIAELRKIGYNYTVQDLLIARTIRNLKEREIYNSANDMSAKLDLIPYQNLITSLEDREGIYCTGASFLTPTQLYMLEAYRKNIVGDNFLQYIYRCPKDIDADILNQAICLLAQKHPALTTAFFDMYNEPIQVFFNSRRITLTEASVECEEDLYPILEDDVNAGFDISKEPLARFMLVRFNSGLLKIIFSVSHMIVDGWSVEVIIRDLSDLYSLIASGTKVSEITQGIHDNLESIPPIDSYYKCLLSMSAFKNISFWEKKFPNANAACTFPHDVNSNEVGTWCITSWIDEYDGGRVNRLCKKLHISENTFFEYAYATTLARLAHNRTVLFLKVVSGRDLPMLSIDKAVGMYINIIPQRIVLSEISAQYLVDFNEQLLTDSRFDKMDFYHTSISGMNLMDIGKTIFVFSNYYDSEGCIFSYEHDRDQDDVDLSCFVDGMDNKYHIIITCKKMYYSESAAEKIKAELIQSIHDILEALL